MDEVITTAERLYYEANPNTKMDVPSFAYEQVEAANKRRIAARSEMSLYDWCKIEASGSTIQESKESKFKKELTSLINKYSIENGSDTPDFLIAEYLCNCLTAYQKAVHQRDDWFGVDMWADDKIKKPILPQQPGGAIKDIDK